MKMTNEEIVINFSGLDKEFCNNKVAKTLYLPAKLNFAISKNMITLAPIVSVINNNRQDIYNQYGTVKSENEQGKMYHFEEDALIKANEELTILSNIENDVNILTVTFEDISTLELTISQMQALMFMIE